MLLNLGLFLAATICILYRHGAQVSSSASFTAAQFRGKIAMDVGVVRKHIVGVCLKEFGTFWHNQV